MHHGRQADAQTTSFLVYRMKETLDESDESLLVTFVVKGHTIELFEGIVEFAIRRCKSRVHRNTLHFGRIGAANVNTTTLLHVAEVDRVGTGTALVGNHGRLHVTNECPLGSAEEWVGLDVGGSSSSAQALGLVLDQQFADQGLAQI